MPLSQAKRIADEKEMDLVEISPNARPPVCKIINYSKFRYEQSKRRKEARRRQKIVLTKEIRLSPSIGLNDLNTKTKKAKEFLEEGLKVKFSIRFRGRELSHVNLANKIIKKLTDDLNQVAIIDRPAVFENKTVFLILSPLENKK